MKIELRNNGKYGIADAQVYVTSVPGPAQKINTHSSPGNDYNGISWVSLACTVRAWEHDTPEAARAEGERAEKEAQEICTKHNAEVQAREDAAARVNAEIEMELVVPRLVADFRANRLLRRENNGRIENWK